MKKEKLQGAFRLKNIRYENFRNYESFSLGDIGNITLFVGENAVGKTNLLEGIQLLIAQNSFKNSLGEELCLWGCNKGSIAADIREGNRRVEIKMQFEHGGRKYSLNGKHKRVSELKGVFSAVMFSPDDLDLVKASSSVRRDVFDKLGFQISANYYAIQKDYEKILRYKNRLLKEEASTDLIKSANEVFLKVATQFFCYRHSLYRRIEEVFCPLYCELVPDKEISAVVYRPSWEAVPSANQAEQISRRMLSVLSECQPECQSGQSSFSEKSGKQEKTEEKRKTTDWTKENAREALEEALEKVFKRERVLKKSLIGPHKDEIDFLIDGRSARKYGSQGQQRSLVLCYKLTEVKIIEAFLHHRPILLLDDVMSELDVQRRAALIRFISDDIQTFITTTNLQYFDSALLERADIIELPLQNPLRKEE